MKKKVLIVEDELEVAELEKDYLELSDFEVTIETDGIKGQEMAMSGQYDMLILDIMLPGVSGFEICKLYREKFLTPVIMVSARGEGSDKVHGLGLGADDYVTKPFNPSELVARVKTHMRRYESLINASSGTPGGNGVLVMGEIKIDTKARRVHVRGKEKVFTLKEFELLCYFAQNPNTVFSKTDLYRAIWADSPDQVPNKKELATITVHIKKVRDKIEENSSDPHYIETLWGSGYRFNPNME